MVSLGRERWEGEVREAYLQLAENPAVKVRRTLAASLGEMAKVIGEEHARKDLVGVWMGAIRCEEEQVRMKAVECMTCFVDALGEGQDVMRCKVVESLLDVWQKGQLKGWREREGIAKRLISLGKLIGNHSPTILKDLLMKALEDAVAYVREAAVSAVSMGE
jgi:serine/threonine-protein phosphatase 4 regulatory subunit 1